jgi:hypothetical protein
MYDAFLDGVTSPERGHLRVVLRLPLCFIRILCILMVYRSPCITWAAFCYKVYGNRDRPDARCLLSQLPSSKPNKTFHIMLLFRTLTPWPVFAVSSFLCWWGAWGWPHPYDADDYFRWSLTPWLTTITSSCLCWWGAWTGPHAVAVISRLHLVAELSVHGSLESLGFSGVVLSLDSSISWSCKRRDRRICEQTENSNISCAAVSM